MLAAGGNLTCLLFAGHAHVCGKASRQPGKLLSICKCTG